MVTQVTGPVMVGRAVQLAELDGALAQVRDGSPATVLIGGEAGIGKTRLVTEFTSQAAARVLAGGCLELGTDGFPFAPFTAMLRGLVREIGTGAIAELIQGAAELARLLPELGAAPGAEGSRARLFEQVLMLLEQLAEPSPVILLIEDAHWADAASRDLLSFLIRSQQSIDGLLIVVTYRSDELHRTHPLRPLLAELDRIAWVRRVELNRLTVRDTPPPGIGPSRAGKPRLNRTRSPTPCCDPRRPYRATRSPSGCAEQPRSPDNSAPVRSPSRSATSRTKPGSASAMTRASTSSTARWPA